MKPFPSLSYFRRLGWSFPDWLLIDAMAKEAGRSASPSFDPVTGRGLSRPYEGNNPYYLKK